MTRQIYPLPKNQAVLPIESFGGTAFDRSGSFRRPHQEDVDAPRKGMKMTLIGVGYRMVESIVSAGAEDCP